MSTSQENRIKILENKILEMSSLIGRLSIKEGKDISKSKLESEDFTFNGKIDFNGQVNINSNLTGLPGEERYLPIAIQSFLGSNREPNMIGSDTNVYSNVNYASSLLREFINPINGIFSNNGYYCKTFIQNGVLGLSYYMTVNDSVTTKMFSELVFTDVKIINVIFNPTGRITVALVADGVNMIYNGLMNSGSFRDYCLLESNDQDFTGTLTLVKYAASRNFHVAIITETDPNSELIKLYGRYSSDNGDAFRITPFLITDELTTTGSYSNYMISRSGFQHEMYFLNESEGTVKRFFVNIPNNTNLTFLSTSTIHSNSLSYILKTNLSGLSNLNVKSILGAITSKDFDRTSIFTVGDKFQTTVLYNHKNSGQPEQTYTFDDVAKLKKSTFTGSEDGSIIVGLTKDGTINYSDNYGVTFTNINDLTLPLNNSGIILKDIVLNQNGHRIYFLLQNLNTNLYAINSIYVNPYKSNKNLRYINDTFYTGYNNKFYISPGDDILIFNIQIEDFKIYITPDNARLLIGKIIAIKNSKTSTYDLKITSEGFTVGGTFISSSANVSAGIYTMTPDSKVQFITDGIYFYLL